MTQTTKHHFFPMRLTERELDWVRQNLLTQRMYRDSDVPFLTKLWEPWKENFLKKITDELYPQEMDQL